MKKLLTGTALALLASATVVSAQEWSVNVGGVFRGGVGYIDIDDGNDNFGILRDPEIHVRATLVADNGLTFGTVTEFEGADANGNTDIDENYMFISGSFGRFELGEADGAADWAKYAGDVGSPWARSGDGVGALFDGAYYSAASLNALDAFGADTSDDIKVSYYTPSIAGFGAGVSYVPSTNDNGRASTRNNGQDSVEFGAKYDNTFGQIELGLGAGYVILPNNDDVVSLSGKVGFAGFVVGASYSMQENAGFGGNDLDTMQVGVSYGTGPWTFGGDVAFHLDEVAVAGQAAEQFGVSVGAAYALAPGVSVGLGGEYLDADVAGRDESLAVVSWVGLRF